MGSCLRFVYGIVLGVVPEVVLEVRMSSCVGSCVRSCMGAQLCEAVLGRCLGYKGYSSQPRFRAART